MEKETIAWEYVEKIELPMLAREASVNIFSWKSQPVDKSCYYFPSGYADRAKRWMGQNDIDIGSRKKKGRRGMLAFAPGTVHLSWETCSFWRVGSQPLRACICA